MYDKFIVRKWGRLRLLNVQSLSREVELGEENII